MRLLRQRAYDQWTLNCTRTFVLNKELKQRVYRPSKVANRTLQQQQCVWVEIRLSMDPDLLAIKVGSGEFRLLFVRQYVRKEPTPTNDALPAQLDNPALPPAAAGADPGVEEGLEGEDLNVMGEDAGAPDGKHDPAPTAEAELAEREAWFQVDDGHGDPTPLDIYPEFDDDVNDILETSRGADIRVGDGGFFIRTIEHGGWFHVPNLSSSFTDLLPPRQGCKMQRCMPSSGTVRFQVWYLKNPGDVRASFTLTNEPQGLKETTVWAWRRHKAWLAGAATSTASSSTSVPP
jgi:hypothetical protein